MIFSTGSLDGNDLLQPGPEPLAGVDDIVSLEVLPKFVQEQIRVKRLLYLLLHVLTSICAYIA